MPELSMSLLVKLGSLVVHCQEGIDTGELFDVAAVKSLAHDAEVQAWLDQIDPVLLPVKR